MKKRPTKAKSKKSTTSDARQLPLPAEQAGVQSEQDLHKQTVTLPTDAAGQRRVVKDAFLSIVGANVIAGQMQPFIKAEGGKSDSNIAEMFVAGIKDSVQPRDAIEEMLLMQLAWTHVRLARLSSTAHQQTATSNVCVLNDACDRAAGTFRRQMLALAEYRRPPRTDNFTVVKQLNAAQQQMVNNAQAENPENPTKPVATNEVGSTPAKALLPHTKGIEVAATVGPAKYAVGMEYRTQEQAGEGPRQQERREAR